MKRKLAEKRSRKILAQTRFPRGGRHVYFVYCHPVFQMCTYTKYTKYTKVHKVHKKFSKYPKNVLFSRTIDLKSILEMQGHDQKHQCLYLAGFCKARESLVFRSHVRAVISSTTLTRKVTGSKPGKDDFLKNFLFFTKQVLKDLWHTVMHLWSFGKYFF